MGIELNDRKIGRRVLSTYLKKKKKLLKFSDSLATQTDKLTYTAKTQYQKFETNNPRKELRSHSPNSYIHVSVSDLYTYSPDRLPILLQENRWIAHRHMNVETETEVAQFPFLGIHKL
jgi:hypothetical protein